MRVAVLNSGAIPLPITVTLTRDGCALLTCSAPYSQRCTSGACVCERFYERSTSGLFVEVRCWCATVLLLLFLCQCWPFSLLSKLLAPWLPPGACFPLLPSVCRARLRRPLL
jgi:hypothetical protein